MDNIGICIAVVQLKGGAGRSTLATNFAVGLDAALVDADPPQWSAAAWGAVRGVKVTKVSTHRELVDRVPLLGWTVIDCGPRASEMTRAALALADLALIPVTPGVGDVWAVQDLLPIIEEAQGLGTLEVRLVWNRLRGFVSSETELQAQAGEDLGLEALQTALGYRAAYPQAFIAGQSVLEGRNATARAEMSSLIDEVRAIAHG